jgi:tetratricopeptide (TPR) repeat protein
MGFRGLFAAVLAGSLATVVALTAAQETSFGRAAALQESGDLEGAAAEYRRFLADHPASVEARSNLGVVLARLGRFEEAIAAYGEALAIAPANTAVRLNLALALYKSARLTDASEAFDRVLAEQPANLQARYLSADCKLQLGRPADAVTLLEPLAATHPDDPALSYLLGMAYLGSGDEKKGQLFIDRILRHGDSAEAHVLMGVAKRRAGDLNEAVKDLKRAVALNPNLPGVRALYGQALLEAGNPDLAKSELEAELASNPLDFDANLYLGVLLKPEDHEAALRHFRRALDIRPGDIPTRYQIASVELARMRTAEATALLEAIVKEAPTFLEAHVALATAYYRQQRKADGDRHKTIVERLTREKDEKANRRSHQSR